MMKYILVTLVVSAVFANAKNDDEEEQFVIHDGELVATPEVDDLVAKVVEDVRATLNQSKLNKFKAVFYRTNFPILRTKKEKGTSFFVKV